MTALQLKGKKVVDATGAAVPRNKHWDGPEFLDRTSPKCFVYQKLTPAQRARLDAMIAEGKERERARIEAEYERFKRPKKVMSEEVKERLRSRHKPKKAPRPADTFALRELPGDARKMRVAARKATAQLKPLEHGGKYLYRNSDKARVVKIIKENMR